MGFSVCSRCVLC